MDQSILRYVTVSRGVTHLSISRPALISALRSSHVFCRFSHSCGVVPKYLASRNAVSALTPRWPFRIILIRFAGTPNSFDKALADSPSVSSSSRSISPGCTGLIPLLVFIPVLVHNQLHLVENFTHFFLKIVLQAILSHLSEYWSLSRISPPFTLGYIHNSDSLYSHPFFKNISYRKQAEL